MRRETFPLIGLLLSVMVLGGCSLPFTKNQAALQINSSPAASVYLKGNHVGQTPLYQEKLKPGEYSVRLMVEDDPTKDWQTQVTLSPQVVTVINHAFGATMDQSANYILQLEPLAAKSKTQISVITSPDNAIVKLDGQPQGFSPVTVDGITEGDHTLSLTAPGYQELSIKAQTKTGYKLVVSAKLGKVPLLEAPPTSAPEATPGAETTPATSPTPALSGTPAPTPKISPTLTPRVTPRVSPTPTPRITPALSPTPAAQTLKPPYVTILETGTGWLRVRSTPSGLDNTNEVARVTVGESYPFVESNGTGWYLIEYQTGKQGWISAQYAKLVK